MSESWVEKGEADAANFKKGIEVYTSQITEELLNTKLSISRKEPGICPKCGKDVIFYPKVAKCSDAGCGLMIFTALSGKTLTEEHIFVLLAGQQTPIIKGFKSNKTGKFFDAALKLDEEYKTRFIFSERKKSSGKRNGKNKP